jgi:hypothetical protein
VKDEIAKSLLEGGLGFPPHLEIVGEMDQKRSKIENCINNGPVSDRFRMTGIDDGLLHIRSIM